MQIGVNLLYLRPAKVGGSEVYIRELIRHLNKIVGVKVILICSEEVAQTFSSINRADVRIVSTNKYSLLRRIINENFTLRKYLNDVDILFYPANFAAPLLFVKTPQVVTVHDLQHLWLKNNFSLFKRTARSIFFRASFLKCKHIIAISDFTRLDIIDKYHITSNKVTTVHSGVDRKFNIKNLDVKKILCRYNLKSDFFIFPAMLLPHKNHFFLIDAFAKFKQQTNNTIKLIFTGDTSNCHDSLHKYIDTLGLLNVVQHLGYLTHTEVLALMTKAKALLFPSKFEGFGLPILEAMFCGTPVIASNATAIPEVSGNAALLIDPR
jgi:glycosyltransferase involved in cell wall biosynthesis